MESSGVEPDCEGCGYVTPIMENVELMEDIIVPYSHLMITTGEFSRKIDSKSIKLVFDIVDIELNYVNFNKVVYYLTVCLHTVGEESNGTQNRAGIFGQGQGQQGSQDSHWKNQQVFE